MAGINDIFNNQHITISNHCFKILNDAMPKTGYLTPMHSFIIGSTFFVTAVCVESLAVCTLTSLLVYLSIQLV